jgi:hypothetical protein
MSLTLGNNLTGLVSRQVDSDGRKARGLGESMTTGNNKFVSVVDAFLGSSLRDNEVVLGAVAKNTAYSVNMLSIAGEYMSSMATALQGALTASSSAGQVSADKIPTLQASLNDKITQLKLLVKTADFDNKKLFSGDVKNLGVQVGLNSSDKLIVNIKDISGGKFLRSSVTAALNKHIANTLAAQATHYATPAHLATDIANNFNLVSGALVANGGGAANAVAVMTNAEFGAALEAVLAANPSFGTFLNDALPTFKAALEAAHPNTSFTNPTVGDIEAAMAANAPRAEMLDLLSDNAPTNLTTIPGRAIAQDVIQNALSYIRQEQSSISNQKGNIVETTDALRATTNVTQQAADSYLKADYVLTAQEYSETLRTMVAAITALQAANKIPEAAQRLLDALTR